jgi:hypothetical protein
MSPATTYDAELAASNGRFRDLARRDSECLRRSTFAELDRPNPLLRYALQPWPTFIGRRTMAAVEEVTTGVNRLIRSIPERIFRGDARRMEEYFSLDASFIASFLLPPNGIAGAIGRADLILTRDGFQCIEFNIASSLGGWESRIVSEMVLRTPVIHRIVRGLGVSFHQRDFVRELFAHCVQEAVASGLADDELNLGIGAREPFPPEIEQLISRFLGTAYQAVLREQEEPLRGELLLCYYPEVTADGDEMFHRGRRVHSLLEWHHHGSDPLAYRCFKAGTVHLYNGPASFVLSNKRCLALLSEEADAGRLSPAECETVRRHIPWTRPVLSGTNTYQGEIVDLPGFIAGHRERLVLKKSNLGGGTDVVLGKSTGNGFWTETLRRALNEGDWVVQQRVESLPFLYQNGPENCSPHDVIWGPFVFGDRFGGVSLRVQPNAWDGVVNLHRGATVGIVLEVEEE